MGVIGMAIWVVICFYWVGNTLLTLPQDFGTIRDVWSKEDHTVGWGDVGVIVFYWAVAAAMTVLFLVPFFVNLKNLTANIVELLRGFMI